MTRDFAVRGRGLLDNAGLLAEEAPGVAAEWWRRRSRCLTWLRAVVSALGLLARSSGHPAPRRRRSVSVRMRGARRAEGEASLGEPLLLQDAVLDDAEERG